MSVERETVAALGRAWDDTESVSVYYEPVRFEVGDRVQIRLSAECASLFCECDEQDRRLNDETVGHEMDCDGCTAVVIEVHRSSVGIFGIPRDGHFYLAECTHGVEPFASCELIPMDGSN